MITQNRSNDQRRRPLILEARTTVYALLKTATEDTAPVLSKLLKDSCDLYALRSLPGGYFDGLRAWAIILQKLENPIKSEKDKDYYREALGLQRANPHWQKAAKRPHSPAKLLPSSFTSTHTSRKRTSRSMRQTT